MQRIHSVDVFALVQLETLNARIEEVEEKWKTAVSNLSECQASWEEQKIIQKKEAEKLVIRCNKLVNQNSILHEQGEKVNLLIISVQPFHIVIIKYCSSSRLGSFSPIFRDKWLLHRLNFVLHDIGSFEIR